MNGDNVKGYRVIGGGEGGGGMGGREIMGLPQTFPPMPSQVGA